MTFHLVAVVWLVYGVWDMVMRKLGRKWEENSEQEMTKVKS